MRAISGAISSGGESWKSSSSAGGYHDGRMLGLRYGEGSEETELEGDVGKGCGREIDRSLGLGS
jgi:hypothetical protein